MCQKSYHRTHRVGSSASLFSPSVGTKGSDRPKPEMDQNKQNHKSLHAWLLEHKLDEYHERLVADEVTELDDFKELEERRYHKNDG
jgi:hypothetical protein